VRGLAVRQTFKRSVDELQAIVETVDRFFAEHAIDPSIRVHVDLSIEELFVNMVAYNRGSRDILLQLQPADGGIRVSLTDYDVEPFDPSRPPPVDIDAPLEERQPGGLGLYLVSKMVDSIHYEYRNHESRITFDKKPVPARHAEANDA
jgi:anti-sigma regulatory factor (Ser/Thr protein kinase)